MRRRVKLGNRRLQGGDDKRRKLSEPAHGADAEPLSAFSMMLPGVPAFHPFGRSHTMMMFREVAPKKWPLVARLPETSRTRNPA